MCCADSREELALFSYEHWREQYGQQNKTRIP